MARKRACGVCTVVDIPSNVEWMWWKEGQPIHPWCDLWVWRQVSPPGRLKIKAMVRELVRQS